MGKVKKQHYVPQRYLRAFATRKNENKPYKFFVFDKELNEARSGNVTDYASERYFYDVDFQKLKEDILRDKPDFEFDPEMEKIMQEIDPQHMEHFFADKIESYLFDAVANIIAKYTMTNTNKLLETEVFGEYDIPKISLYLTYQLVRSKEFRQFMTEQFERLPLLFMKKMTKSKSMRNFLEHVKVELADENQKKLYHAQFLLDPEFINEQAAILCEKIWIVGINITSQPFYTSDNPVVKYGHLEHFGLASKGIEIAFPITPKLILILRDPEMFSGEFLAHNHFHFISDEENVIYYNSLQVQQSYRNVFSKEENFDLAKEIVKKEPHLRDPKHYRFEMF